MKKITLEEAYAVPNAAQFTPQLNSLPEFPLCRPKLEDLAEMRLRAMDEGEIDLQVISPTSPSTQGIVEADRQAEIATAWNEYIANAIEPHKKRLRAFAALPTRDPDALIKELTHAVKDLGMVGGMINGYDNAGGGEPVYYDAPQYLDFWKVAEELDVPVYLHPRVAPPGRVTTYGPYPEIESAAWGFHIETAEHVLRIILSGMFDKAPNVKILIGHLGELLPWWCWRIDHRFEMEGRRKQMEDAGRPIKLTVTEYVRKLYCTTSGMFYTPGLLHTLSTMPPEHVLYSVDYPYESNAAANEWWKTVDLPQATKEAIAYKNAEKLLKVKLEP